MHRIFCKPNDETDLLALLSGGRYVVVVDEDFHRPLSPYFAQPHDDDKDEGSGRGFRKKRGKENR